MIDHLDHATFELTLSPRAMTPAERQKKLRQLRKESGVKPLHVTPAERELLGKALRLFGRVSFSPERDSGDVAALLGRVVPDGPQGQELDDFALLEVGDADLQPNWASYDSDFARAAAALGVLRLRNSQHAELVRAVQTLKGRLVAAGLDDQAGHHHGRGEWYWNKTPLRDFCAEEAPEYMERQSAGQSVFDERDDLRRWYEATKEEYAQQNRDYLRALDSQRDLQKQLAKAQEENEQLKAGLLEVAAEFSGASAPVAKPAVDVAALQDEVARLRAQLEKQHSENLFTIAEQGKAATAVSRLQRRLKAAGLPDDYRALPGEL